MSHLVIAAARRSEQRRCPRWSRRRNSAALALQKVDRPGGVLLIDLERAASFADMNERARVGGPWKFLASK
jgi:hypothetical protein